jgi:hypothetical protein
MSDVLPRWLHEDYKTSPMPYDQDNGMLAVLMPPKENQYYQ